MGQRWDQFITGLGNQSAPFGFAPGVDPKTAGMNTIGGIGANMLANVTQNPLQAFGGAYKQQLDDSRNQSRDALTAKVVMDQMEEKKRERAKEQELEAQFNQYVSGLPPDQQALARFGKDAFMKAQIEKKFPDANGSSNEMGLQPAFWKDAQGNLHANQLSKSGGMSELKLPDGGSWAPGMQMFDTGTAGVPINKRTGLPEVGAQPIPKNNVEEAAQKAEGTKQGEAVAAYKSMASKMPGLEKVVSELGPLAEKATYTSAGRLWNEVVKETGNLPTEGAVARTSYIAMVDNQVLPMLRDTFGAQFTVMEGDTLRATLGDPNKTPQEKKAVLKAFIEQKRRNIEADALQATIAPPGSGAGWSVEEVK